MKGESFQIGAGIFHMFPDIDSAPKHYLCGWCRRPLSAHADRKTLEAHAASARMALQTLEREGSAVRGQDAQGWHIVRVRVAPVAPTSPPSGRATPATADPRTFADRLAEKRAAVAKLAAEKAVAQKRWTEAQNAKRAAARQAGADLNPYVVRGVPDLPKPLRMPYRISIPKGGK